MGIRRWQHIAGTLKNIARWHLQMRSDPLYRIAQMRRGLQPAQRTSQLTTADRTLIAKRIIAAYAAAKSEQPKYDPAFGVSNEWLPFFEKPLTPLISALRQEDAIGLRDLLDNFFREPISQGLCGFPIDMQKYYFARRPNNYRVRKLLIDSLYRYRLLSSKVPDLLPSHLHLNDVGNPYGLYIGDAFVRTGSDYTYYYAHNIAKALNGESKRVVVAELGGGIGGFAAFLLRIRSANLSYVNFDLPEILAISTYQLLNLFPDRRARLFDQIGPGQEIPTENQDIILLPSFCMRWASPDSVNVSFNSFSLAEMSAEAITLYTGLMSKMTKDRILHVNHVRNSLVSGDDFQFDTSKFRLVSRERAMWNFAVNPHCDEYEFDFVRISALPPCPTYE